MRKVTQIGKEQLFLLLWFFSFSFYALPLYIVCLLVSTPQAVSIYGLMVYVAFLAIYLPLSAVWSGLVTLILTRFSDRLAKPLILFTSFLVAFLYYTSCISASIVDQKPLPTPLTGMFWVSFTLPAFLIAGLVVMTWLQKSNPEQIWKKVRQVFRDAVCLSSWVSSLHFILLVLLAAFGVVRQYNDFSAAVMTVLGCCVILFPTNFVWALTLSLSPKRFYSQMAIVLAAIFHLFLLVPLSKMHSSFTLDSGFSMDVIMFSYSFVLVTGFFLAKWWDRRKNNATFARRLRKKDLHVNLSPDWNSVDN